MLACGPGFGLSGGGGCCEPWDCFATARCQWAPGKSLLHLGKQEAWIAAWAFAKYLCKLPECQTLPSTVSGPALSLCPRQPGRTHMHWPAWLGLHQRPLEGTAEVYTDPLTPMFLLPYVGCWEHLCTPGETSLGNRL